MKLFKKCVFLITVAPSILFATVEQDSELPQNATAEQAQQYIDNSKDCMIVQNKKQIVMKCGDNMIFVTSEGVGIKTHGVSKFWS